MENYNNPYSYSPLAADASVADRATFYKNTYLHLSGALIVTIILESLLIGSDFGASFTNLMFSNYIISFLLFIGLTWFSGSMIHSVQKDKQYIGLGLYVLAYTLFFLPMLSIVSQIYGPEIIQVSAIATGSLFGALTTLAFLSKKDFSFLGKFLVIGSWIAFAVIIASMFTGGALTGGLWFPIAMVVLMSGIILYQTSQIKYEFTTDQHVGAAAMLYGSFMTLFLYILRIFMSGRD